MKSARLELRQHRERIEDLEDALRIVYHRLLGTIASDWVSPNPMAQTERGIHCQYTGCLTEFILDKING